MESKDIKHFANFLSHDLRQPISSIKSFIKIIKHELENPEPNNTRINIAINRSIQGAERLESMVEGMISLSAINFGGNELSDVNLNKAVEEAIENLIPYIEDSKAVIYYGSLPTIKGKKSHFIQLFQNLIANSIKFKKSTSPIIKISSNDQKTTWLFSVEDNGIGVPKDKSEDIFQLFKSFDLNNENYGGGVGLTICKTIVEHYGGKIWLDKEFTNGARFYFHITKQLF